jgi:protein-serine/threonine kinase
VYRRVLASARGKVLENDQQAIEGDLIDLSESQTITAEQVDETTRDLECLIVSHDEQALNISPKPPICDAVNNLDQRQTSAGQESTERENIPPLDASSPRPKNPVNVPGLAGSNVVSGGNRDISEIFRGKSENPTKEVRSRKYVPRKILYASKRSRVGLARKVEGGVQVAIKIVTKPQNPDKPLKIDREASILRQVDHPNIVRFHEIIENETRAGIVLDYASGGDLFDYINNHLYLKNSTARKLFAQLISGVGFLHRKGIVHRQLNLNKILLDRNHNITICGFTSARTFISKDELGREIERNLSYRRVVKKMGLDMADKGWRGVVMQPRFGKPIYAAPELVLDKSVYAAKKIDIWSCGIILVSAELIVWYIASKLKPFQYAMLAGHLPFKDDFPADHVANLNLDDEPLLLLYKYISSTPLAFPEYVDHHARDLLRRVIVVDPHVRADMAEVAQHTWLKEYESMLAGIYRQSGGANESGPKPNDGETVFGAEPSPRDHDEPSK